MNIIKTIAAALCAAALCVLTAACAPAPRAVVETVPEEVVVIKPASGKGNYITVGRTESYSYTDNTGNVYNASYKIPQLTLESEDAQAINAEINEKFARDFANANNEITARNSLTCDALDYESHLNQNVLSIVIRRVYFSHAVDYTVYNLDVKTGTRLGSEELCAEIGRRYSDVRRALTEKLEEDYNTKYQTASHPQNYEENHSKTVSEDNVSDAALFLDDNGALNAICKEYANVGAGVFSVVLQLD